MRASILACLIIIAIAGCTDRERIPDEVLGKEKMEQVLWDMVQADRFVTNFLMQGRTDTSRAAREKAAAFYAQVFDLNKITRAEFIRSYKFYLGRPDLLRVMFDSISSRAESKKAQVYEYKQNPLFKKRDSIMRADSIRKADSIDALEEGTGEMSDSALKKALFN